MTGSVYASGPQYRPLGAGSNLLRAAAPGPTRPLLRVPARADPARELMKYFAKRYLSGPQSHQQVKEDVRALRDDSLVGLAGDRGRQLCGFFRELGADLWSTPVE